MIWGASILGGSWINGQNAGSRYANLDNWPGNADDGLGLRLASDDQFSALRRSRPCRPATSIKVGGQPARPASANTFQGPVQRGVGRGAVLRASRPATGISRPAMAKRYRNLIGPIATDANMLAAYRLTARGKRLTPGYLEFKEFSALNLDALARDFVEGCRFVDSSTEQRRQPRCSCLWSRIL
jgi:hypothetical protein